ncbi:DNA modification methylase [Anaerococcus rubeinfantis]|uniref:DNA modification methylase n=1 Tax=Anaerococcus rubeinfantis TaxID=1720199 RepID=UPI001FD7FD3F|nr:DNA modification methylase [Anaerococcus rubeinfantis]
MEGEMKKNDDLRIIYKEVDELVPYVNNPRDNKNAVDAVASSIKNFGFKVPIVIDRENEIVTGHTRLLAAKKLGMSEVPVVVADDLSDAEVKAFRLADNKVSELSGWDWSLLESELDELEDLDLEFDMEEFGFDLLSESGEYTDVLEDEFDDELPVQGKTKSGNVWILGKHRLMCGNSLDPEDVNKLMRGERADLLLTDPPYNINYQGATEEKLTIQNDSMGDEEFREFLTNAFSCADSVMKPGASFYIWHAESEGYNFRGSLRDVGWQVRQCIIWNKSQMTLGRQDYQWKHEPCLYGWTEGGSHSWYSDRKQTTVLNFDKPLRNGEHPTMKPVELFAYLIENSSKKGDAVLDLFGGSGTTLIGCEQLDRRAYIMELDERYCDVIINRWEEFTGNKAILEEEI